MKVLICGSRDWIDLQTIAERMAELPPGTLVIQGRAKGADKMARYRAVKLGMFVVDVPVEDDHWMRYGKSAGHRRNHAMLDLAPDLVLAFQRNGSSGTQGTIDEARRRGIPVEVVTA